MKPFILKEHIKNPNRKIVTRDGVAVRIICTDFDREYPIVGAIKGHTYPSLFTEKGCYNSDGTSSPCDLFFAPEKKEKKEIYNTNNNIYAYTEKQFGRVLSATEKEEITKWPDTELTMYAIKQAMLYGKSNVKYISKIIEAYGRENIQTVQQAQQREREYAEAKKRKQEMKRNNGYQRNTKTIEPEPEWLNKKIEKQEVTSKEREEMDELLKEYK